MYFCGKCWNALITGESPCAPGECLCYAVAVSDWTKAAPTQGWRVQGGGKLAPQPDTCPRWGLALSNGVGMGRCGSSSRSPRKWAQRLSGSSFPSQETWALLPGSPHLLPLCSPSPCMKQVTDAGNSLPSGQTVLPGSSALFSAAF